MTEPDLADRMLRAWQRFERALPSLGLKKARLAPGATDADIGAFEMRTKLTLPDEVRQYWRGHDGERPPGIGLAGGFLLLSLGEATKTLAD